MSRDLPCKKSQLDLKLFGVRVPSMGFMMSPWLPLRAEVSKMSLLVARVWHAQQAKEGAWMVLTHRRWNECAPWKLVKTHNLEGNTWVKMHHKLEGRWANNPKWWLNQQQISVRFIHTYTKRVYTYVHKQTDTYIIRVNKLIEIQWQYMHESCWLGYIKKWKFQ